MLLDALAPSEAARLAARITGAPKNVLYRKTAALSKSEAMDRITLRRPDDWHLHLRDGAALASVLADSARRFARAIVMPNLKPAVRTTAQALDYRSRILAALPEAG